MNCVSWKEMLETRRCCEPTHTMWSWGSYLCRELSIIWGQMTRDVLHTQKHIWTHTLTQLDTPRQMDTSGHTPGHTPGHIWTCVITPLASFHTWLWLYTRHLSPSPRSVSSISRGNSKPRCSQLFVCLFVSLSTLSACRCTGESVECCHLCIFGPNTLKIHPAPTVPASLPVLPILPLLLTRPN